jgi:hypothetical protein
MGYLTQASATVANSSKMTISMWAQFTDASDYVPMLEFGSALGDAVQYNYGFVGSGDVAALGAFRSCRIFKRNLGGVPMIFVHLAAPYGSFSESDILAGFSGDTANPDYAALVIDIEARSNWTPTVSFLAGDTDADLTPLIAPGKWFHLFLSVDFSSKDGKVMLDDAGTGLLDTYDDPDNSKRVWLLVNGQDFGMGSDSAPEFTAGFPNVTDPSNGYCRTTLAAGDGVEILSFGANAAPPNFGTAKFEIPPWSIAFNGNELALPCVAENATGGFNPSIRYADVQIWVNKFIDPTNAGNLANFRTADGKAVPPSVAAASFGPQTFLLKGNAASFVKDEGTGGAFSKAGPGTDIAPGP